jgi:hypothetical protein
VNRDFWRTPAFIFLLPLLVLTTLFLGNATGPEYYGVARLAQAASAIGIIVPLCAGLAAWEGARLRRGGALQLAPARTEWAIAARGLLPIVVTGVAAIAVATLVMLASGPRVTPGDFRVLLVPVAVLLGHAAIAYAAGRSLRAVFAVPGAIVASWFVIAYSIAIEPLWVRHLTGTLIDCCDVATVPATGALVAPVVIAAAACVAAAVVLTRMHALVSLGLACGILAVAVGIGVSLVSDLDSEPTEPRSRADLRCDGRGPRVCLFPEHESAAGLVADRAQLVYRRLTAASIDVPEVVSEARPTSRRDWSIGVVPGVREDAVDTALIEGLMPTYPPCADGEAPYPGFEAYRPVALWLAQSAGVSTSALDSAAEPTDRQELEAVRRLPRDRQLDWYHANVRALAACAVEPTLLAAR